MSSSAQNVNSQQDGLGFLVNTNAVYVAELYTRYLEAPSSVDDSWVAFFKDLDDDTRSLLAEVSGASWSRGFEPLEIESPANSKPVNVAKISAEAISDSLRAMKLVHAFRVYGHLKADIDPLGLMKRPPHPELSPSYYGFTTADYDRPIHLEGTLGLETANLRQLLDTCHKTYCGKIGVEYMHMMEPEEKEWFEHRIEAGLNKTDFTDEGKKAILKRLAATEGFERFLHVKYPGTKRFGIDGGESMVPAIEQIMKRGGQLGLKEVVIGMAHRGRLNVLTNVMGKSYTSMFALFMGKSDTPEGVLAAGDVKYHLGASHDRDFDGNEIHLSLNPNPSHLEAVDPVVIGKVKAKQYQRSIEAGGEEAEDKEEEVLPLLLHGDAAFAGQGLVAETLMMSQLDGYRVGGTIHFIINNQIGFTTPAKSARSGPYSSDVAKMIEAPILHVNGDDPEAVVHSARIAIEYRQKFKRDIVIDMYCYRRNGHNEGDEPMFTQPLMYKTIKAHPTTFTVYSDRLVRDGLLNEDGVKAITKEISAEFEDAFKAAEDYQSNEADMLEGRWSGLKMAEAMGARRGETAISEKLAKTVGNALTTIPEGFDLNKKIARTLEQKKDMFKTGEDFDWATAEAMAFGSLVHEGYPVRLSGQDCERGTFSHRHSVWNNQSTPVKHVPLNNIDGQKARYSVYNSPLSEAAVLGYEYGFSSAEPRALVMWEAQFGDFANGAQVIIDQFIASSETKWLRMMGLVMMLPHGQEGQGPEHSSARLERYLQLCAMDNMQVVNCTTPANYFHVLRRQVHRDFRKPLIVMSPKSLLRHKMCVSPLAMMTGDSTFHRVLYEDIKLAKPKDMKRVILCSGKVYYDLVDKREELGIKDVTMLRLEQLYPFPDDVLAEEIAKYPNADVIWCQEEPENQGAWHFVDRRIETVLTEINHKVKRPVYVGRLPSASTAPGIASMFKTEQNELLETALKV